MMTMAGDVIPKGFVFSDHGKIVNLGSMDVCPSDPQAETNKKLTVIDADGRFLLPGLVDAHSHLGMIADSLGFEGDDINEGTDPITPHLRAMDAIYPGDRGFE